MMWLNGKKTFAKRVIKFVNREKYTGVKWVKGMYLYSCVGVKALNLIGPAINIWFWIQCND